MPGYFGSFEDTEERKVIRPIKKIGLTRHAKKKSRVLYKGRSGKIEIKDSAPYWVNWKGEEEKIESGKDIRIFYKNPRHGPPFLDFRVDLTSKEEIDPNECYFPLIEERVGEKELDEHLGEALLYRALGTSPWRLGWLKKDTRGFYASFPYGMNRVKTGDGVKFRSKDEDGNFNIVEATEYEVDLRNPDALPSNIGPASLAKRNGNYVRINNTIGKLNTEGGEARVDFPDDKNKEPLPLHHDDELEILEKPHFGYERKALGWRLQRYRLKL